MRSFTTYAVTLVVAYCSIVYELLLAQTLSALMGNTVLRYSVTIGVYLASLGAGAILCRDARADTVRRLVRIEILLSILGGLSVLLLNGMNVVRTYFAQAVPFFSTGAGADLVPYIFLLATHGVIVAIGLLSGFEVPLLIALREKEKADTANVVLGVDYFGALLGSVLFPLVLLPRAGVFAIPCLTALLNVAACLLLLFSKPCPERRRYAMASIGVALGLLLLLALTPNARAFFLKKFYYYRKVASVSAVFDSFEDQPAVEAYRSVYQRIHLVRNSDSELSDLVYPKYSGKFAADPAYPRNLWLFLNEQFQFFSNTEEIYHEFFVHVPIQLGGLPERVLVLGAGDGLVTRELLKYAAVRSITQVDLDPRMLDLARHHPQLRHMNGGALDDPRVELVVADAFTWLQDCERDFDAIWVDFPSPKNYDLSRLYSVEFYSMVRERLTDGGYVTADVPGAETGLWRRYASTFNAAGMDYVRPFDSALEPDNPEVRALRDVLVARGSVTYANEQGYPGSSGDTERVTTLLDQALADLREGVRQRFVFLMDEPRAVASAWREYGVPLHVLDPRRFALAIAVPRDHVHDSSAVNSIFRPTLPEMNLTATLLPY